MPPSLGATPQVIWSGLPTILSGGLGYRWLANNWKDPKKVPRSLVFRAFLMFSHWTVTTISHPLSPTIGHVLSDLGLPNHRPLPPPSSPIQLNKGRRKKKRRKKERKNERKEREVVSLFFSQGFLSLQILDGEWLSSYKQWCPSFLLSGAWSLNKTFQNRKRLNKVKEWIFALYR